VILHLQEHLFHLVKLNGFIPGSLIGAECVKLPRCDLVGFDGVAGGEELAHFADKGLGDLGR
jgi:hypothetical protein